MSLYPLPDKLSEELEQRASAMNTPADQLLAQAVEHFLWQLRFKELLDTVHANTKSFAYDDVQDDITAARMEVREIKRASTSHSSD
jgi:hypothetical protein